MIRQLIDQQMKWIHTRPGTASRRPRVLHLINNFDVGGTERQAVRLLQRLDLDRYDIRLAALRNQGPFYQDLAERFPDVPEFPLTSFYNANAARQLGRLSAWLVREQIEVLHTWDFYSGLIGVAAGRLAGVQVLASQRNMGLSDRPIHARGQRLIHRLSHMLLVNSEAIRDHIIAHGAARPEKIVVVNNGLSLGDDSAAAGDGVTNALGDTRRAAARAALVRELGIDGQGKLIGMVANLRPVKGHRFLIGAAAQLVREGFDVHFVLIGEGALRKEIEEQIAQLALVGRVHLLGNRLDVAQLVPAFDLGVLSSCGNEGSPNALIEMMAAGVPVVATSVSGVTELVTDGETGYLAHPGDADALAQRIALALRSPGRTAAIAECGRQRAVSRYSLPRMVETVERLYDVLLSQGQGGRG